MQAKDFISIERLATYEKHTDRESKAIALHNHTLQLGSSLMSMIALLELSLRNSTNRQLVEDFGEENWLIEGSSTVPLRPFEVGAIKKATSQGRRAAYSKLSYREKGFLDAFAFPQGKPSGTRHKTEVKRRQDLFFVPHGQVVSQLTFSFWKRLYSAEYDSQLWKPSLKKVFPNKKLKRPQISKALEEIYKARNRVAHHEPIYGDRLEATIEAIEFVRNSLGAKKGEADSSFKKFSRIQYLRLRMDYEGFLEAWATLT